MTDPLRVIVKADRTSEVAADIHRQACQVVEKAARDIEANASTNCVAMGAVDTGNLLNSIAGQALKADNSAWRVYAGAEYAAYVNYGTRTMGARPFFTDAVDQVRPVFNAAMRQLPGVA